MKIQYVSDLHLEFGVEKIVLPKVQATGDVMVVAGDLSKGSMFTQAVELLHEIWCPGKHMVVIPGNHEFYGRSYTALVPQWKEYFKDSEFIHFLDKDVINIDGVWFLGAVGWWDRKPNIQCLQAMNDFSYITDIKAHDQGAEWGRDARIFLERELETHKDDKVVVVTHNAPSHRSVAPRFVGSMINSCFHNEWEDLIMKYRPKAWIHGHMHNFTKYEIGNCVVTCNPIGYMEEFGRNGFTYEQFVEV